MPSPETSRVNLGRARNPWTDRSREESVLIWRLTLQWWLGGREGRPNPRTQRQWAEQLGVKQSYIAKMVRRIKRDWLDMAAQWRDESEATLDDLRRLRDERLLNSTVTPGPQSVVVARTEQRQPQARPAWASYSTVHPAQIDAAILAYIGFNPNRSKGWF